MTTTNLPDYTVTGDVRPGRNRSGADIGKYLVVKLDAANAPNALALTAADTDVAIGVTMELIKNGYNGDVLTRGRHRVTASGAIAAGVKIAPDANGKVKAAAAGDTVIGTSEDAATADGDIISAELAFTPSAFW